MTGTTLLIHGGAHGAWCWAGVLAGLGESGASARAFDLPGAGEDPTPRAALTLADSIEATVRQIDSGPAGGIRLVAHSIAGMLVPPVVAHRPDRVTDVVLVAAVVLRRGERGIDTVPAERRPSYFESARASGDNTVLPAFEAAWQRFFTHLPRDAALSAYERLTPQPFAVYLEEAACGFDEVDVPVRYLALDDDRNFDSEVTARFAAKAGVEPAVLPGDHCVMLSQPEVLVRALSEE